ncbi:hypothetical protein BH09ACT13_BH09ACT13_05780 [soil metagenome]
MLIVAGAVALPAASPTAAQDRGGRGPASVAAGASNSQRYSDPRFDASAGGLDITTVALSNDDAGRLRFTVTIPSHQTLPSRKGVGIFFDTDRNTGTGSALGSEYRAFVEPNSATDLYRWDAAPPQSWVRVEPLLAPYYERGVWGGGIRLGSLGSVSAFDFYVGTFDRLPGGGSTQNDSAPNSGKWTYQVKIGGPSQPARKRKLTIVSAVQKPNSPMAGQVFAVETVVRRVNWSGRFNGKVFCGATIGGRPVPSGGSSVGPNRAMCRWKVPTTAAGKTIKGLIEVTESGASATRKFSARVVSALTLSSDGVTTSPPRGPEAGRRFYYYLGVNVRLGSGSPKRITTGKASCLATVGGSALEIFKREVTATGVVRCGWIVPDGTTGQTMVGSIVVQSKGVTLRHPLRLRIR